MRIDELCDETEAWARMADGCGDYILGAYAWMALTIMEKARDLLHNIDDNQRSFDDLETTDDRF